jgi:hypothetical protein
MIRFLFHAGPVPDNILSRYEIGRMLGKGGFGSVYEGKRLEDGLEVSSFSYN